MPERERVTCKHSGLNILIIITSIFPNDGKGVCFCLKRKHTCEYKNESKRAMYVSSSCISCQNG